MLRIPFLGKERDFFHFANVRKNMNELSRRKL